jgi:purine-binding chemotaxis protein CheW
MEKNVTSYLTFKIGKESFAANVENIQNIIEYSELTQVPEMPPFIIGVTNLRGEVLPVVDSRIKLGIPVSQVTTNTCIIVMELTIDGIHTKAGMLVDEVSEVLEIADNNIKEPPTIGMKFKTDTIPGIFSAGDKFVMLLDVHKVVASEELLSIQEV